MLDTLRKELVNAIAERGLDTASVDIDAILVKNGTKSTIEEKVRLAMDRDGTTGTFKTLLRVVT